MSYYKNQSAYIISTGCFLPGQPVSNDDMENRLGLVNNKPSRYRRRILKSNGIESRYYALDENGESTHMTDELAAEAILQALRAGNIDKNSLEMIAVGTTLPDLPAPGIASMVQGRIGGSTADILSCAGICGSGAAAFKAAALAVIAGQHNRVVSCGTERPSVIMRGERFKKESTIERAADDDRISETYNYFSADFLRWMLSDGAGAFIIDSSPNPHRPSMRIEWVETASFANELPVCMYMGTSNPSAPAIANTWLHQKDLSAVDDLGLLLLRQDTKLLAEHIVRIVADYANTLAAKNMLDPAAVDRFLPHISSFFFKQQLLEAYDERGIHLPEEKWFTNLKTCGNTGAASMYIMLDALFHSDDIQKDEKILLMIPESGRFSVTYALLTVV